MKKKDVSKELIERAAKEMNKTTNKAIDQFITANKINKTIYDEKIKHLPKFNEDPALHPLSQKAIYATNDLFKKQHKERIRGIIYHIVAFAITTLIGLATLYFAYLTYLSTKR